MPECSSKAFDNDTTNSLPTHTPSIMCLFCRFLHRPQDIHLVLSWSFATPMSVHERKYQTSLKSSYRLRSFPTQIYPMLFLMRKYVILDTCPLSSDSTSPTIYMHPSDHLPFEETNITPNCGSELTILHPCSQSFGILSKLQQVLLCSLFFLGWNFPFVFQDSPLMAQLFHSGNQCCCLLPPTLGVYLVYQWSCEIRRILSGRYLDQTLNLSIFFWTWKLR
jgi:hypothetical protein